MKRGTFLLCGILPILFLAGCGSKPEFWDISKFHIDTTALHDGEEIKLLYTSRGPDYNANREYYIHLIAVSQKSGDTVNILTVADNDLKPSYGDTIYNYFDQNSIGTKLIESSFDKKLTIENISDIEKLEPKKIDKISRDPRFDDIADNNYPTVIGSIGKLISTR